MIFVCLPRFVSTETERLTMSSNPTTIWFAVCKDRNGDDVIVGPTVRSARTYFGTKAAALQHGRTHRPPTDEEREQGIYLWQRVKPHAVLKGTVTYEVESA